MNITHFGDNRYFFKLDVGNYAFGQKNNASPSKFFYYIVAIEIFEHIECKQIPA